MRDERTTNDEQLKIELLSQWKLEAEFRNNVFEKINALCFLNFFDLSEIGGDVTMRDGWTNDDEQLKIELLSQWKLEAEFRNSKFFDNSDNSDHFDNFYNFNFFLTILTIDDNFHNSENCFCHFDN